MEETRRFRGISRRLAVQYLETLGGERVDGDGERTQDGGGRVVLDGERVDPDGARPGDDDSDRGEPDPVRVEGDGWRAELSAETVEPAGSVTLTEVTVDFEGDAGELESLVEAFARKAIRAGG